MSNEKAKLRIKRKKRIRKKISGSAEKPRLSIFRSNKGIYAQVINDVDGKTLIGLASHSKSETKRAGIELCEKLGETLASKCREKNINTVVFDRNGYVYHGRVKAFADGARKGGLNF